MIETPSLFLALAAGVVSFLSPCCLPLVPGYLATVCGKPAEATGFDHAVMYRSLVFVGGFSLVFILLGLTATAIGSFLLENSVEIQKIAGVAIIALGLFFVASVFFVRLNRDWRPIAFGERAAQGGPLLAGVAFAFAWTPCVGPTLGAILGLASVEQSTAEGAGLLAVYSLGLAIPFFLSAIAFGAAQSSFGWIKRHYPVIQLVSGLVLVAMGILVYTGELFRLNAEVQQALDALDLNFFQSV
jgi:cytochrome c-type biogenesis protein